MSDSHTQLDNDGASYLAGARRALMGIAVVTGSGGLIGSEWVRFLAERALKADYPGWRLTYGIGDVLHGIYEHNVERWAAIAP